jgi:hypothetical protein
MNEVAKAAHAVWSDTVSPGFKQDHSASLLDGMNRRAHAQIAAQAKLTAELREAEAERARMSTQPKPRTPEEQADWDARMAWRDKTLRDLEAAPRLARQAWHSPDVDSVTSVGTPQSAAPLDASDLTRGLFTPS